MNSRCKLSRAGHAIGFGLALLLVLGDSVDSERGRAAEPESADPRNIIGDEPRAKIEEALPAKARVAALESLLHSMAAQVSWHGRGEEAHIELEFGV